MKKILIPTLFLAAGLGIGLMLSKKMKPMCSCNSETKTTTKDTVVELLIPDKYTIPTSPQEGTNYYRDESDNYFKQGYGPLIKTIAVKIPKEEYVETYKKYKNE